jgi:hypothetical protein
MLIKNKNYQRLIKIPDELTQPIMSALSAANWTDGSYDRSEGPLKAGKLIEFPFPISRKEKNYSSEQKAILESSSDLLDWIMAIRRFKDYKWIRGEVATLIPGVELGWHKDPQWFHDNCVRLHVPLITNDQCFQTWKGLLKDKKFHMETGWLYELNNRVLHSAYNQGLLPRTHLILDLMPEEKWKAALDQKINPVAVIDSISSY